MRRTTPLLAVALLLGCSESPSRLDPTPEDANSPIAGGSPKALLDRAKVGTDLAAIRTAIQMYRADHEDANAPSLESLGVTGLQYPDAYTYDAATGTVTCDELPGL